jgi:hypothetical protein
MTYHVCSSLPGLVQTEEQSTYTVHDTLRSLLWAWHRSDEVQGSNPQNGTVGRGFGSGACAGQGVASGQTSSHDDEEKRED